MATQVSRAGQVSLEGMHSTVPVPPSACGFLGALAGVRRTRDFDQRRVYGPRELGDGPAGRGAVQVRVVVVVGLASLMAIFMQVISARLGVVTVKICQCCAIGIPRGHAGRTG